MELQRIVGRESDVQTSTKEERERIALVVEEQAVVAQGRDREADLREVVQILERRREAEVDAVIDAVRDEERRGEMVGRAALTTMWTKVEGVWTHARTTRINNRPRAHEQVRHSRTARTEAFGLTNEVERLDVDPQEIHLKGVRRITLGLPVAGRRKLRQESIDHTSLPC